MLTKAIIQSIDYTKNICRVRIPLFENASRNVNIIEADAQFTIVPGIYNSYKTGDIVFIGFEENKMERPVILGKLFVSAAEEAKAFRGNLSGNSLAITESASLPYSTIFNYANSLPNNTRYQNLNTPKKLADNIIELQQSLSQPQTYQTILVVSIANNIYKLYLKTTYDFTCSTVDSYEPVFKLCAALKNSQGKNSFIPLDAAVLEVSHEDETGDIITSIHGPYQALLQVQDLSYPELKLNILMDGHNYEVDKDAILSIQSHVVYY